MTVPAPPPAPIAAPNGGAFAATSDCANDGTDGCADRAILNGFLGLAALLDRAVVT
jgi:hypothetical protein